MVNFYPAEEVLWFCMTLTTLVYAVLFWTNPKKKNRVMNSAPQQPFLPWKEEILKELSFLEGPFHIEQPKEAMARFSALVDTYVQKQYRLEASFLTTAETLQKLNPIASQEEIQEIALLLQESDQVKFAKQEKAEEAWQILFAAFRKILENPLETIRNPFERTRENPISGKINA